MVRVSANVPGDVPFMTTEEVLGYLQVNLRTVYRLIKAGRIPAVRVGRQWRFRKRDIDAWLDGQRASAVPTPAGANAAPRVARVLVVDDESSIREMLRRTLSQYRVDTAGDANAALHLLRTAEQPYKSSASAAVNLGVAGYLTTPFQVSQGLAAAARARRA